MAHFIPSRKLTANKPKTPLRLVVSTAQKEEPKASKRPKPKSE